MRYAAGLHCLLLLALCAAGPAVAADDPGVARLERSSGLRLLTTGLQAGVGPELERPSRPVRIVDLPLADLPAALRSLGAALDVYPPGFVAQLVHRVAMAGSVSEFDLPVGGAFQGDLVVISYANVADPQSAAFDTDTFHHEFSSIVRNQVAFNVTSWTAANPPGFKYMDLVAYKKTLQAAPRLDGDEALHRDGFVSDYGRTGLDNDFNTFAEKMFGHPTAFSSVIARHPRMQAKARQLMDVYESLDNRFEPLFVRIGLRAAAGSP